MVLSDVDIHRYLEQGKIKITPTLPPEQFGSCSVDFRLGHEFSIFEHSRHPYIDLQNRTAIQELMRTITVPAGEPFILQPHEFALAITEEILELDDEVLGRLEGRSSLGRIGIIVHGTAGLFDPGWIGKATLVYGAASGAHGSPWQAPCNGCAGTRRAGHGGVASGPKRGFTRRPPAEPLGRGESWAARRGA